MRPNVLDETLVQAFNRMNHDPKHLLPPIYRSAVYQALIASPGGARALSFLAIITAHRVLPVWERAFPADLTAQRMMGLAGRVMAGRVDLRMADEAMEEASQQLSHLWSKSDLSPTLEQSFYAGDAALNALATALGWGDFVFLREHVWEETDTDDDVGSDDADTALLARMALTHGQWEDCFDVAKSREFWVWWVTDAVTKACQAASQPV
jgi:hypothetical protein